MDVIIELLIYIGIVSIEALVWVYIKSYWGDILCRKDFGRKSQADNENHIGFRPSTGDESEKMQHSVAAESTEKSLPKSAK